MTTRPLLPGRQRRGKWDHLAWAAIDTPNTWITWPNQQSMSRGVRETYNNRIRRGLMWGPSFTSEIRDGWLYIKHLNVAPHNTSA